MIAKRRGTSGKDIREKTAQTPMARLTAIVMKLDGGSKRSISEVSTVWQTSPTLRKHMLRRGFSHEEIRKILGLNFLRVFRETWKN